MTNSQNGKRKSAVGEALPSHLLYLDGLRGFAALYVAIFHSYQMQLFLTAELDSGRSRLFTFLKPLCMGHYAVTVFIVLSGYCLMLPVARSGAPYALKGGFFGFFGRRARRILPAFYAAVVATVILLPPTISAWDSVRAAGVENARAALNPPQVSQFFSEIVSHILLVNNGVPFAIDNAVRFTNNTPLWSVATEWQIYFLFPLLLLPVLRRFGPLAAAAAGLLAGELLTISFHGVYAGACPWMLGVFSLGMLGAMFTHSPLASLEPLRRRIRWGVLSAFTMVIFLGVGVTNLGLYRKFPVLADSALGLGVMALLIALAQNSIYRDSRAARWIIDVFSSRPARTLGGCSYSLYLIHYPLLILSQALLVHLLPKSLIWVDVIMLVPVMAVIAGLAYLFSLAFERPFVGKGAKRKVAETPRLSGTPRQEEALTAPERVAAA